MPRGEDMKVVTFRVPAAQLNQFDREAKRRGYKDRSAALHALIARFVGGPAVEPRPTTKAVPPGAAERQKRLNQDKAGGTKRGKRS